MREDVAAYHIFKIWIRVKNVEAINTQRFSDIPSKMKAGLDMRS